MSLMRMCPSRAASNKWILTWDEALRAHNDWLQKTKIYWGGTALTHHSPQPQCLRLGCILLLRGREAR